MKSLTYYKLFYLLLIITYSKDAFVSQDFINDVAFEFIDNYSSVVLVVENKTETSERVAVTHKGNDYPDFKYSKDLFSVVKILRNEGEMTIGSEIEALPADFDVNLEIHKDYVIKGMSRSPSLNHYKPVAYKPDHSRYIIFLTTTDDGRLAYYCFQSIEGLEYEKQVSNKPKSDVIVIE